MIAAIIISSAIGIFAVIGAESLRIRKKISIEASRKCLHAAHGLVVIAWQSIAGYQFIIAAELIFFIVVLAARYTGFMQPLRNVNRKSWGEFFFPAAVIILALLEPPGLVFTAAMLHLAIADSAANFIGRQAKSGRYKILGQTKSLAGSLVFFMTSVIIMSLTLAVVPLILPLTSIAFGIIVLPIAATLAENVSVYGSDNFSVPLVVYLLFGLI